MKRSIVVLVALVFPVLAFCEDPAILDIRKKYNSIEAMALNSLAVNFELEDDPMTGKVTFYSGGGELKKVVFESGSEHGGSTESFYYSDGKLFFVFKQDSYWTFSGKTQANGQSETIDTLKELRFYYQNGSCIRSLVREAKSTDADQLGKEISKVSNAPLDDNEATEAARKKGAALYQMKFLL